MTDRETPKKPGLLDVLRSVLASFFGVQSERNRQRDFEQGNPVHYVVIGLLATLVFVAVIWLVVSFILETAGG